MKKTLFIKIDNSTAPVEAENDYIPLDCKQINDFCSFVGDALIGDLKDCNGTPLYRLINPAGRLLSDFEKVDKANYDLIIAQWLDILSEILHKGVSQTDEQFTICFQQQYTNWLLNSENDYFVEIGKSLQANDGKVSLDIEGISEDIISALHMKITRFLNKEKDEIEYIVFSNERIGNSSYIAKQLKTVFDSFSFLRLEQWEQILREEQQKRIEDLEDVRAFWLGDLKLGVTTKDDIPQSDKTYYRGFHLEFKKEGKLSRMWTQPTDDDAVNAILSILYGETKNRMELSYNNVASYLIPRKGFYVSITPCREWSSAISEYSYHGKLRKDADVFFCEIEFTHYGKYMDVSDFKELKHTLWEIYVELK